MNITKSSTVSLERTQRIIWNLGATVWRNIARIATAVIWKIHKTKSDENYPVNLKSVAVVTGGEKNSEVFLIKELIKYGYDVIVGTKHPENCERLIEFNQNKDVISGTVTLLKLDLTSLKSVKAFVDKINEEYSNNICILVNNFNQSYDDYRLSKDGFEMNLVANFLSHFYLTHLLVEKLRYSGENNSFFSRVVNVVTPEFFGARIAFKDINNYKNFQGDNAYGRAKMAALMMTKYLDRLMKMKNYPIQLYAVDSGLMDTSNKNCLSKHALLKWIEPYVHIKPSESAQSILHACLSKELEFTGGNYLSNCNQLYTPKYTNNKIHQRRLFLLSCELLGIEKYGEK